MLTAQSVIFLFRENRVFLISDYTYTSKNFDDYCYYNTATYITTTTTTISTTATKATITTTTTTRLLLPLPPPSQLLLPLILKGMILDFQLSTHCPENCLKYACSHGNGEIYLVYHMPHVSVTYCEGTAHRFPLIQLKSHFSLLIH